MKVRVNQDACIGCGACEQIDDELFKILSSCELEKQETIKNSIKDIIQLFNTQ